jgi:alanine dehydrogenase
MPSAIPKQISHGLERAKLTYLVAMLMGLPTAIESFPELSGGLNVHQGQVTNEPVAKKHDLAFVAPEVSLKA